MHRRLDIAAALAGLMILATPAHADVALPAGFVNDTLLTGLAEPNSMAFLPDGRLLITEQRTGNVRLFVNGHIAASDPVLVVPDLTFADYERGLQGVAIDPRWPARPWVYLYYTHAGDFCRLVRYTATGDLSDPAGENFALGDSLVLMDDIPDLNPMHQSGCLRFGPGGYLFVSLGDDHLPCGAADSTSLRGELLRLDVSGLPDGPGGQVPRALITPPINPLVTSDPNARLVWAYGMRNPWRYDIDPVTGAIYAVDVGEMTYDELNEVLPGDFLGWPFREGPEVEAVSGCPERGGIGANNFKGPLVAIPHAPTLQAVTTAGMYRPVPGAIHNWPQNYYGYYGDVFYGEYFSGYLRRLKRQSGFWAAAPPAPGQPDALNWATGLVSASDFQVGPDGSLWWLAQFNSSFEGEGGLYRIRWAGTSLGVEDATSPVAALTIAPNPFRATTRVEFVAPARENVTLALYDVAGRRVRELFRGAASAGPTTIEWNGKDDLGRAAAPGLYFARLDGARARPHIATVLRLE